MIVQDPSSGRSQTITRATHDSHRAGKAYASYSAVLPKDHFEISFELAGVKIMPSFRHNGPVLEAAPVSCTNFLTSNDLSLIDPHATLPPSAKPSTSPSITLSAIPSVSPTFKPSSTPSSKPSDLTLVDPNEAACDAYFQGLIDGGAPAYHDKNCNGSGECAEYIIAGRCTESIGHTAAWGKYSARCPLEPTVDLGNTGDRPTDFRLVPCYGAAGPNPQDDAVFADGIMHFAHGGRSLFFWPTVSDADVSAILPKGTRVKLFTTTPGSLSPYQPPASP